MFGVLPANFAVLAEWEGSLTSRLLFELFIEFVENSDVPKRTTY